LSKLASRSIERFIKRFREAGLIEFNDDYKKNKKYIDMTKEEIKLIEKNLIELTSEFCAQKLDEDYAQLCIKLIQKMGRKRDVPFQSGKVEIWAAAVIYALGSINFLFDKAFEPYATPDDICEHFDTKKTSVASKAKIIKNMFNMSYYSSEFSTKRMNESNPFNKMRMVNGFIVMRE